MIDEALVLAKFFEEHAESTFATCSGDWDFPVAASYQIPPLTLSHLRPTSSPTTLPTESRPSPSSSTCNDSSSTDAPRD